MGAIDLLLLAILIVAITWGLLSQSAHAKGMVAAVLWIVVAVSCSLMALLHRGIASEGRSSEYTEGVVVAVQALRPFLPYLLLSATGLALLAVTKPARLAARVERLTMSTDEELLGALMEMRKRYPEWRIGQLVANVALLARGAAVESIWDVTDEEFIAAAKQHLKGNR